MPPTPHWALPNSRLPRRYRATSASSPNLAHKPRPHAMMKYIWLVPLKFIGGLINVCAIRLSWEG